MKKYKVIGYPVLYADAIVICKLPNLSTITAKYNAGFRFYNMEIDKDFLNENGRITRFKNFPDIINPKKKYTIYFKCFKIIHHRVYDDWKSSTGTEIVKII